MRSIIIGKPESKICATCEFWEGPKTVLKNRGFSTKPNAFMVESCTSRPLCIKAKRNCGPNDKCAQHQFRYDLMRYL